MGLKGWKMWDSKNEKPGIKRMECMEKGIFDVLRVKWNILAEKNNKNS